MDNSISNNDLKRIIEENNQDMQRIVNNTNFNDLRNNDELKELFMQNLELYKMAKSRNMQVDDYNFMMALATSLGYNIDDYVFPKKRRK